MVMPLQPTVADLTSLFISLENPSLPCQWKFCSAFHRKSSSVSQETPPSELVCLETLAVSGPVLHGWKGKRSRLSILKVSSLRGRPVELHMQSCSRSAKLVRKHPPRRSKSFRPVSLPQPCLWGYSFSSTQAPTIRQVLRRGVHASIQHRTDQPSYVFHPLRPHFSCLRIMACRHYRIIVSRHS